MENAEHITPEFHDFKNKKTFEVKIKESNYTFSISDNYSLNKLIKINNIFNKYSKIFF